MWWCCNDERAHVGSNASKFLLLILAALALPVEAFAERLRAMIELSRIMKVFGQHDADTVAQLERCAAAERNAPAVLCADGHLGYSMPIGGVVGYRSHVSPSGVGYDIACGNLAVQTNLNASDVPEAEMRRLAREIERRISFGIGRKNTDPIVEHPVFDRIASSPVAQQRAM